jgi:hypothetical protein
MASFQIQITAGPADPAGAAPGCPVAPTARRAGHRADRFPAGDAVPPPVPAHRATPGGRGRRNAVLPRAAR